MRLHYKIAGLCVLLCLCFSSRAYSQFGRGGAADMTKTENLLDSLRVAANTMAALTRSNQESSQRMEAMTDQIRYLTWAIAGLTLVQIIFGVLNFRTAKAATTSPKPIRILPRAARRRQKYKKAYFRHKPWGL